MSRSDGGHDDHRVLREGRQLLDDAVKTLRPASLQSFAHQIPSPPLLRNPFIRSKSTQERSIPWNKDGPVQQESLLSPADSQSPRSTRRPNSLGSRHDASRDPSPHVSENLTVSGSMRARDEAYSFDPGDLRSRSSPTVSTRSTIRLIAPSVLSANDMTYGYDYLDKGEFRLILVRPERRNDPGDIIRCTLFTRTLDNCPQYIALSYAWGDVSDTRHILVGEEEIMMSVSASLESALRALRDSKKSIWVWADAISINQQDPSEKAHQVRLMTRIYKRAKSVSIWLGPRSADSDLGMELIHMVSIGAEIPGEVTDRTPAPFSEQNFAAVVALFDREYWHRLWVVQEVFNAQLTNVHCGPAMLPWKAFEAASDAFRGNRDVLERSFHPGYTNSFYQARFGSYSQVLIHEGPGSLTRIGNRANFRDGHNLTDRMAFQDLLEVMRNCRRKLSSEPKDKVFGILGVLSEKVRNEITVDYNIPVKDVYINIFRTVVEKTDSLNILCESIHFPPYTNNNNLPSWVPDWSHVSWVSPIATTHAFSASRMAKVDVDFTEKNKLRIGAIPLGKIKEHGIAVGTLLVCTVSDYLMAFLHWRACLSHFFDGVEEEKLRWLKRRFSMTLSLDHIPEGYNTADAWMDICYHVFAYTIHDRLPTLQIDHELEQYIHKDFQMDYNKRRLFLQEHFGSKMMGRCFCITDGKRLGMGTGFMARGDVVVVPLGCSTPVVLRPEGDGYRFVGDVYIDGYMYGKAVEECNEGFVDRRVRSYVIH